jgi:hypothetical protein
MIVNALLFSSGHHPLSLYPAAEDMCVREMVPLNRWKPNYQRRHFHYDARMRGSPIPCDLFTNGADTWTSPKLSSGASLIARRTR